jgi:hypothetical protein
VKDFVKRALGQVHVNLVNRQLYRGLVNHEENPENAETAQQSVESLAETFLETLRPT